MTKQLNPPSVRRLSGVAVAVALAALAGAAAAQTGGVVNRYGEPVLNRYGECVASRYAAPGTSCPPAAIAPSASVPPRVADSPRAQQALPAAAAGATGAQSSARLPGYATAGSDGNVVLSGFGQCVRAGHWTPANAAEPCDRMALVSLPPPPPPVAEAPKLEPAPAPQPQAMAQPAPAPVAPEPPRPVIQKLTLSSDVLFDFNSAELKEGGKQRLDELASQVKDAKIDEIIAVGHADRIASEEYNQKLSEARAEAVKDYLAGKVANANRVTAEGKGESQPITGDDCKKMGAERASNKKLVSCLQPDRRVEIEVLGTREVAGEAPAAGTGATSR